MIFSSIMDLPPIDPQTGEINIIIETPKGCRNKYNFDPHHGLFKLKKVLPAGAIFPFDFGFVPNTLAADGDPIDVLVLMSEPAYPGCLVPGRLIGIIEAKQTGKGKTGRNDRLIAVACREETFCKIERMDKLNEELVRQIEHFFISYNKFEGKTFTPLRRCGPRVALKTLRAAEKNYQGQK